jgi:hypothetical protein
MSLKESVLQEIDHLDEVGLRQVANSLAFQRFQSRLRLSLPDGATLAALYAEFGDEDRELAEAGMDEYAGLLIAEDVA